MSFSRSERIIPIVVEGSGSPAPSSSPTPTTTNPTTTTIPIAVVAPPTLAMGPAPSKEKQLSISAVAAPFAPPPRPTTPTPLQLLEEIEARVQAIAARLPTTTDVTEKNYYDELLTLELLKLDELELGEELKVRRRGIVKFVQGVSEQQVGEELKEELKEGEELKELKEEPGKIEEGN